MLKRYILFVVLSFLVFWGYSVFHQTFYPPRPQVKPAAKEEEKSETPSTPEEVKAPAEKSPETPEVKPAPPVEKPVVTDEMREKEKKVWLENGYCRMTFTRYGAAVDEILLYTTETNKEVVVRGKQPVRIPGGTVDDEGVNPLVVTSREKEGLDLSTYPFDLKKETDRKLAGELTLNGGLKVTKSFELADKGYLLTMDLVFENQSEQAMDVPAYQVKVGAAFPVERKAGYKEMNFLALGAGKVQKLLTNPKKSESKSLSFLRWASVANKYFALILSPEPRNEKLGNAAVRVTKVIPEIAELPKRGGSSKSSSKDEEHFFSLGIGAEGFDLKPGKKVLQRFSFYAGPKEYDRLKRLSKGLAGDRQLEKVMSFGVFGFVGIPLLKVLNWSYKVVPNYGLAIIFLTILVKIILYPLDQKSYKSMKEMQKLQPLIAELRKKYKDDPRQAQVEQMKLFKEHKVNPLGGCLPMLLQMPVLIAMFGMIRSAVELRRAPFALWIKDLSEADAVLDFGVEIPVIGHSLNILPLILVATFLLQNKISKAGSSATQQDPQQKMMGHFMTVFFGIIFYNMPSGLNLYFAVSTVLRAIQQYFVQKKG